jgi:hypothetical protein
MVHLVTFHCIYTTTWVELEHDRRAFSNVSDLLLAPSLSVIMPSIIEITANDRLGRKGECS